MLMIGDNNLTYHHEVELIFTDVVHIRCDINVYHPQFSNLGSCPCGCEAIVIGIQAEEADFEIAAEKLEIVTGTVFHYHRRNLQPGERIAQWVDTD